MLKSNTSTKYSREFSLLLLCFQFTEFHMCVAYIKKASKALGSWKGEERQRSQKKSFHWWLWSKLFWFLLMWKIGQQKFFYHFILRKKENIVIHNFPKQIVNPNLSRFEKLVSEPWPIVNKSANESWENQITRFICLHRLWLWAKLWNLINHFYVVNISFIFLPHYSWILL